MRVLALDVGDRRIGVAVSDPGRVLARSLEVIERDGTGRYLDRIMSLVEELNVGQVLVGHPILLDGTVGHQARQAEEVASALQERIEPPVLLWDERLSTVSAGRMLIERGERRAKRRQHIDAAAAAVILQSYLDAQQWTTGDESPSH